MDNRIPRKSKDCVYCHKHVSGTCYVYDKPCKDHPNNSDYTGYNVCELSDFVNQTVGKYYQGPFADGTFLCTGYDIRAGFWMQDINNPNNLRNVSERAIGRTYHHIWNYKAL